LHELISQQQQQRQQQQQPDNDWTAVMERCANHPTKLPIWIDEAGLSSRSAPRISVLVVKSILMACVDAMKSSWNETGGRTYSGQLRFLVEPVYQPLKRCCNPVSDLLPFDHLGHLRCIWPAHIPNYQTELIRFLLECYPRSSLSVTMEGCPCIVRLK
jgi:hypothetical protein